MLNKLQIWTTIPLVLAFIIALTIFVLLKFLPPKTPLLYSLPWGEGQLVESSKLLIIPATIAIITLLNLVISWQLHPSQVFFKKVLLVSPLVMSLILIITLIKIILNFT